MDFQHFAAAVLDPRDEAGVVVEHTDGDIGLFFPQDLCQPPAMFPLFKRVLQDLGSEGRSIVRVIIDAQVVKPDGRIHRERRRQSALVGGYDNNSVSVSGEPVGLKRQRSLHPARVPRRC